MAFDPITAGIDLGGRILDVVGRYIPDPGKAAEAAAKLLDLASAERTAQMDVNAVEAASASLFVSGWRPAVGWCGAGAVAWNFVLAPLLTWGAQACGLAMPPLPTLDSIMAQLLFGLLGLTIGARTVEKVQGVARP